MIVPRVRSAGMATDEAPPEAGPTEVGTPAAAVACSGLRRTYGAVLALDGIDLEVRTGELLAVLGPSGCGKTTLLRLIAGFEPPDSGTVAVGGRLVAGPTIFVPPERRRVGIVVQDHALFPHLTVAGNVAYGLPGRRKDSQRVTRVAEVLALVGLEEMGDRYPEELSGGQQQRVAIARALAPRPNVVLLDEPFANLDAVLRARMRTEVADILRAAGATVVLVTHDQEEALSLADRVAVLNRGRVVQVGRPDEIYRTPADPFVARFVGDAGLVAARSDGTALETPIGRLAVSGAVPAPGPALAVVRPETLRLTPDPGGRGRVLSATYFGHDQLVDVALDGDDTGDEAGDGILLRARVGSERLFAPGDRVQLEVAEEVVAFPA